MPPKTAQKPKEEAAKKMPAAKVSPAKPHTPKKAKVAPTFNALAGDGNTVLPININFEGCSETAKLTKDGVYSHTLKLEASAAFSLTKTVVLKSGEFEGQQAILIQPAKSFPFLKLSQEIRKRIFELYFAPHDGGPDSGIAVDGKRPTKDVYAKHYANGSKNRVALLAVNREIHAEAIPILYRRQLRFESTTILLEFLSQVSGPVRARLWKVRIKTFNKATSRTALSFLAEATELEKLHIDRGLFSEADEKRAAKMFWAEAAKLLTALNAAKGGAVAAVDVLSFGADALTYKNDKKVVCQWSDGLVERFRDLLHQKLK